jgi:hypothetical protein
LYSKEYENHVCIIQIQLIQFGSFVWDKSTKGKGALFYIFAVILIIIAISLSVEIDIQYWTRNRCGIYFMRVQTKQLSIQHHHQMIPWNRW